jgi:hypothetical protein
MNPLKLNLIHDVITLFTWFQHSCIKEDTCKVETNLGLFLKKNKLSG